MSNRRCALAAFTVVLAVAVSLSWLHVGSDIFAEPIPPAGVAWALAANGSLSASVTTVVDNGSALRYAMDGNFTPLVASLPLNATQKSSILATINLTESNPFTAGLFGDHDGSVSYSVDVVRFESLILTEAKTFPAGLFTGTVNVSLDNVAPSSERLVAVTFANAVGPIGSPAPVGATIGITAEFTWSGTAHSHTFRAGWNVPPILGNLTASARAMNFSFSTPNAMVITSVAGLASVSTVSDPLGFGPATASGQYKPLPTQNVTIAFGPAFPTGYVLVGVGTVLGAGVLAVLLLWRRRRRRSAAPRPSSPAAAPVPEGVETSSGSA